MWRYVLRWVVPDVSGEHNAFSLRVQSKKTLLLKTVDSTDKHRNNLQYAETQKMKIIWTNTSVKTANCRVYVSMYINVWQNNKQTWWGPIQTVRPALYHGTSGKPQPVIGKVSVWI
jgi:hypothetical protein